MDSINICADKRIPGGKGNIRRLKQEGFIPGVLYSNGVSVPISLEEEKIREILNKNGEDVLLNLDFEGSSFQAQFKEIQRDPVTRDVLHIDIMPVSREYPSGEILH